jgi:predicted transcriptional regulator
MAKRGPKPFVFDLEKIEQMASVGMTQAEIAYALGTCPSTWNKHIAEGNSEISAAYKRGKGNHAVQVFVGLSKLAKNGNPAALIFLAKAHHGRRENIEVTHKGDGDFPLELHMNVQAMTPEQRQERIAELERKRLEAKTEKD